MAIFDLGGQRTVYWKRQDVRTRRVEASFNNWRVVNGLTASIPEEC